MEVDWDEMYETFRYKDSKDHTEVDWDEMYEKYRYRGPTDHTRKRKRCECDGLNQKVHGCSTQCYPRMGYTDRAPGSSAWMCEWCDVIRAEERYDKRWTEWTPEQLSHMEAELREQQMEMYQI